MNATTLAQNAYSTQNSIAKTSRNVEYDIFARVTRRLQTEFSRALASKDSKAIDALARKKAVLDAVNLNRRLWNMLAADVATDGNTLPIETRASILSLNEFTTTHSRKILTGNGSLQPLIEINKTIMRGLATKGSTA